MIESGIVYTIWKKHKPRTPVGCLGNGLDPLGMDSLLGIFLIFIIGLAVAVMILVLESLKKFLKKSTVKSIK